MVLGWSAAFPLLVGALCMMLGVSFGHIFCLDHFYIPGLFKEGFNKSLTISMWTIYDNCGIPNGQCHNFRVSNSNEDGLVTTMDTYFRSNWLKKRRFRFVGESSVGTEGDLRVFVLSPSLNSSTSPTIATWFSCQKSG